MDIEKLKQMADLFPDDALMQFTLGNKFYEANEFKNALIYLEKSHQLDNAHMLTHLLLGNIYAAEGLEDKAREILERALELIPTLKAGQGQDLEPDIREALAQLEEDEW